MMSILAALFLASLAAAPAAPAAPETSTAPPTPKLPAPLITVKDLQATGDKASIVDARSNDLYEQGHIPGAISLPWIDMAQMPRSPILRDVQEIGDILTSKGISFDRPVIVYGSAAAGFGEEGWVYWTLTYLGHPRVSVLDGGVDRWKQADLPLSTQGPIYLQGLSRFVPRPKRQLRIEKLHLSAALKQYVLVDVRDPDEFQGARKFGEPRGGRIPGSINVPWRELLASDGSVLPRERLREVLSSHGVDPNRRMVVYCTGGIRSGFAFMALKSAGIETVLNFDGSFWEWATDRSLPVVTGDERPALRKPRTRTQTNEPRTVRNDRPGCGAAPCPREN